MFVTSLESKRWNSWERLAVAFQPCLETSRVYLQFAKENQRHLQTYQVCNSATPEDRVRTMRQTLRKSDDRLNATFYPRRSSRDNFIYLKCNDSAYKRSVFSWYETKDIKRFYIAATLETSHYRADQFARVAESTLLPIFLSAILRNA